MHGNEHGGFFPYCINMQTYDIYDTLLHVPAKVWLKSYPRPWCDNNYICEPSA
jgi:hypothetical protein